MSLEAFFIVGFVRSGSTALAEALGLASNADVTVEVAPKLLVEARDLLEHRLQEPKRVLLEARAAMIADCNRRGRIFGDKNASYLPFLPWLTGEIWNSKVVFLHRDGRDAVRSLVDWHAYKARNIYTAEVDEAGGQPLDPTKDPWAYFYLRPQPDHGLSPIWRSLPRFEKCAWYWAEYNRLALEYLSRVPHDRQIWIGLGDRERTTASVQSLYEFLGLDGFDRQRVAGVLHGRVNSLAHRLGTEDHFPAWRDWSPELHGQFNRHAAGVMRSLGYAMS